MVLKKDLELFGRAIALVGSVEEGIHPESCRLISHLDKEEGN